MARVTYLMLMGVVVTSALVYVLTPRPSSAHSHPDHPLPELVKQGGQSHLFEAATISHPLFSTRSIPTQSAFNIQRATSSVNLNSQRSTTRQPHNVQRSTTQQPVKRDRTKTPHPIDIQHTTVHPSPKAQHSTTLAPLSSQHTTTQLPLNTQPMTDLPRFLPLRDAAPDRRNVNVFLVDSANNTHPNYRAWCGVESWARENPRLQVWFMLTSPVVDNSDLLPSRLLRQYPNLMLARVPILDLFTGTPLYHLFTSETWRKNSAWPIVDLSDMLRVLFLWHWGGVYSDTDIVCVRPFTLPLNAVGFFTKGGANNALLSFARRHKFLSELMEDMRKSYRPREWGVLGPQAVTRVLQRWCGASKLAEANGQSQLTCNGVTVYPQTHFYPVPWQLHQTLTKASGAATWDKKFNESFVLHMWNKLSKNSAVKAGGDSIYDTAAKAHCPLTYHQATLRSSFF